MTARPHAEVTLVMLAGGQGRRLGGVPKALLRVGGRTILERFDALAESFGDALLIANDPGPYQATRARIVPDAKPGHGAPGGLHAALSAAHTPWVVLLASDMPFVTLAVLEALLARRAAGLQWICTEREGRLNPLPGVYARALLPAVERQLPQNPSFRELLAPFSGEAVAAEALRGVDPELRYLEGINTREDAERLGAELPIDPT